MSVLWVSYGIEIPAYWRPWLEEKEYVCGACHKWTNLWSPCCFDDGPYKWVEDDWTKCSESDFLGILSDWFYRDNPDY